MTLPRTRLSMNVPATPPHQLAQADPVLARLIDALPEPRLDSTYDVFFDLMSCLLEQQIHYRSTKKTFQKLLDAADLDTLSPGNFHLLEERALGSLKLSASKYETVVRVLDFWEAHTVDWPALPDDEVRLTLAGIKGIGSWTIDMILLYTLQRPNVFPADDFHLKQIMTDLYGLDPNTRLTAQMKAIASTWQGQASLAVTYLLAWKTHRKKR